MAIHGGEETVQQRPRKTTTHLEGFKRIPRHVGLIPDGNRRWAAARGLPIGHGYRAGVEPGLRMLGACRRLGIREVSIYGFTKENVRRPASQVEAFRASCEDFGLRAVAEGAALLAFGDADSALFPPLLAEFTRKRAEGALHVNLLVNYNWQWDLGGHSHANVTSDATFRSAQIPRVDLVVRWGGRRRLSGFLPLQCAYADLCVLDGLWPDAQPSDMASALRWYQEQELTLGG